MSSALAFKVGISILSDNIFIGSSFESFRADVWWDIPWPPIMSATNEGDRSRNNTINHNIQINKGSIN